MGCFTRGVAALAPALLVAACSSPGPVQPSSVPKEEPAAPNTLTPAEQAAGWQLLFDGLTTSGWRGFHLSAMPGGWAAVDGALTLATAGVGDIITLEQFGNFELALEWQISEAGNSGIMYRVSEAADFTFLSGPEMQVLDNTRFEEGALSLTSAGACYSLYAPTQDVTRPAGAWNQARIVASGNHIEHWLNGVKIVEYEIGSADWLARLQTSVLRDAPGYGRAVQGHIAVQDHGNRVAYRNIKIRRLP